ncbi:hypothetical protein PBI_PEREGRIN_52 [Rhodococcus phage Peregrin]|nr:hypothetical protein PBI_PEREGRIN_52 [Rhodococcus phage Peregrin]
MTIRVVTKSALTPFKDKATLETFYYRKCWFAISFDYNTSLIQSLKKSRAWWSPNDRTWCLPFSAGARKWILEHRCVCSSDAQIIIEGLSEKEKVIKRAIDKHYPNGPTRRVSSSEIDGKMWLVELNQKLLEKELQ